MSGSSTGVTGGVRWLSEDRSEWVHLPIGESLATIHGGRRPVLDLEDAIMRVDADVEIFGANKVVAKRYTCSLFDDAPFAIPRSVCNFICSV